MTGLPILALRQAMPQVWERRLASVSVDHVQAILREHETGQFYQSAALWSVMLRDERIAATSETRINACLGCDQEVEPSEEGDQRRAKKVALSLESWWWDVCTEGALAQFHAWALGLGVAVGEIVWAKTTKRWTPIELRVWDMQAIHWDDQLDCYIATTESGDQLDVRHGDGRWVVWEPYGRRSWMHGAIRAVAFLWLMRQWAYRDWARFSERLGQGILKLKIPAGASDAEKARAQAKLRNLGAEGIMVLPAGADAARSWDLDLLEVAGRGATTFSDLIASTNVSIAIRLLGQNLTTEVQGGSYAAANVQDRVRHDYLEWDAGGESTTLHTGIAEPWAWANEGDRSLAPWVLRQTDPPEDQAAKAATLSTLATAATALKALEKRVDVVTMLEEHGVPLLTEAEAAAIEAKEPPPPVPPTGAPAPDGEFPSAGVVVDPSGDLNDDGLDDEKTTLAAARRPPRAFVEGQTFVDGLVAAAVPSSAETIAPDLAALTALIGGARTPHDVTSRLAATYRDMSPADFADLCTRAFVLAELRGRAAVLDEL